MTLVVMVACSMPTKPSITPGQVIAPDDGTLTTRADQLIEITVRRAFASHEAEGTVVIKNLTVDEARRSPLGRVARGRAWLQIVHAIEAPEQGYVAAMRGLDDMGTEYLHVKKPMFDDTGMHVKLAKIATEEHAIRSRTSRGTRERLSLLDGKRQEAVPSVLRYLENRSQMAVRSGFSEVGASTSRIADRFEPPQKRKKSRIAARHLRFPVEIRGIEPLTSRVRF